MSKCRKNNSKNCFLPFLDFPELESLNLNLFGLFISDSSNKPNSIDEFENKINKLTNLKNFVILPPRLIQVYDDILIFTETRNSLAEHLLSSQCFSKLTSVSINSNFFHDDRTMWLFLSYTQADALYQVKLAATFQKLSTLNELKSLHISSHVVSVLQHIPKLKLTNMKLNVSELNPDEVQTVLEIAREFTNLKVLSLSWGH